MTTIREVPADAELDLHQIEADLEWASSGTDGPDTKHHPHALTAMRAAEKLLAEVRRLREANGQDWPERSRHAAFDFARGLRDVGQRRQMADARYAPGMATVACDPSEPIGEVLRRVDQVEKVDQVFVAVRDGEGWALLVVPKPTRTEAGRG